MSELNQPSGELRERILAEVSFEQRFIAYRLHKRLGLTETALYSFEDVVGFLYNPIPQLNFDELEKWFIEVIGDRELAEKVNEIKAGHKSDLEKMIQIRDLMSERLIQCLNFPQRALT